MSYEELLAKIIEETKRPLTTGKELSQTYADFFDRLDQDGYLNEGEREVLALHLARRLLAKIAERPIT